MPSLNIRQILIARQADKLPSAVHDNTSQALLGVIGLSLNPRGNCRPRPLRTRTGLLLNINNQFLAQNKQFHDMFIIDSYNFGDRFIEKVRIFKFAVQFIILVNPFNEYVSKCHTQLKCFSWPTQL